MPKIVPQLAGAFLVAALFLAAVTWNHGQVLVPLAAGGTLVVFADGDCHSRMQRAALVAGRPGTMVHSHDFENHPAGTVPHTTAPLDYLIAALALFIRPLEVAGAWVSPLLGLLALLFLFYWSRTIDLRPRGPMLFLFAVSPALTHAFALGRPDHQSLLVALTVTALAANFAFVRTARPAWAWASASLWGFALWVSWLEPLVLLAAQELGRAIALRKAAYPAVWRRGLYSPQASPSVRGPWRDSATRGQIRSCRNFSRGGPRCLANCKAPHLRLCLPGPDGSLLPHRSSSPGAISKPAMPSHSSFSCSSP